MRILFLFSMAILLIADIVCLVGCSRDGLVDPLIEDPIDDSQIIKKDTDITGLEISISESRPAQVMVTATTDHLDTCILDIEIYQKREGNTISLWATKTILNLGSDGLPVPCGQAVTSVQGQISIGEFTVGEYKVIADGLELAFHIEEDESWVITKPSIGIIDFSISESVPDQVIVNVEGEFWQQCLPFVETRQKQEEDTTYIQITGKVPSSIRCPSVFYERDMYHFRDGLYGLTEYQKTKYQKQIYIDYKVVGSQIRQVDPFCADHKVVVNGVEIGFLIE